MENEIILNEFTKRFSDLVNEYKSDISVIMNKLWIVSTRKIYMIGKYFTEKILYYNLYKP